MRLNLGAFDRRIDGFLSVDIVEPADIIADLSKPWIWEDSSVDEIIALDVIEHLPDKILTMNEMYRVLKPQARATIEVPTAARGAGAFQDPTHRSYWTRNDFQYYEHNSFAHTRGLSKAYGITARFAIILITEREVPDQYDKVFKIRTILQAVK